MPITFQSRANLFGREVGDIFETTRNDGAIELGVCEPAFRMFQPLLLPASGERFQSSFPRCAISQIWAS
jgi:hypothetical protein